MGWKGLQAGRKKALKRIHKRWFYDPRGDKTEEKERWFQRSINLLRNTTKLCSAAIHGCGNRRDLEGATFQERKAMLTEKDEF